MDTYFERNNLKEKDLVKTRTGTKTFKMGSSEFKMNTLIQVPVKVKAIDQNSKPTYLMSDIPTYIVKGDVPFLVGLNQLMSWKANVDNLDEVVEIFTERREKPCTKILAPQLGETHTRFSLEPLKEISQSKSVIHLVETLDKLVEESNKTFTTDEKGAIEKVFFIREKTEDQKYICSFHEGSGHKGAENIMHALSQAEMIAPEIRKMVKKVVDSCKICKKYSKSMHKVMDINQIVTWDLKSWGKGFILWMVCSFSRFITGVYIVNKEMETMMMVIYYG